MSEASNTKKDQKNHSVGTKVHCTTTGGCPSKISLSLEFNSAHDLGGKMFPRRFEARVYIRGLAHIFPFTTGL